MFEGANLLAGDKRKYGQQAAMEIAGDIHEYTELYGPEKSIGIPHLNGRQVFDFNEHFIELGTATDGRSLFFMVFAVLALMAAMPAVLLLLGTVWWTDGGDMSRTSFILMGLGLAAVAWTCVAIFWRIFLRAAFFTALTARYRFNRTTGKVYVLRPKKFGGNAVLDWHRVKAHPAWCTPLEVKPGWQYHQTERDKRKRAGGGVSMRRGLVLYWPPLDVNDPERKGEDILWVGKWLSGTPLWEYIRTFMQEGMQAVPAPEPHEYRRKRRSSMWQYLWEEGFDATIREARLMGDKKPESAVSVGDWLREGPFVIFNSWAQWLCWWPTFPKEWNSDCGQKRRERGIGVEEPLRWKAKA